MVENQFAEAKILAIRQTEKTDWPERWQLLPAEMKKCLAATVLH